MKPRTMMTQHPDAAAKYVSIQAEPEEAIDALLPEPKGLGIEEVMVDFEGKLTPYQQTAQIVLGLIDKGVDVGQQIKVTPRIPSGREEGVFRQLMALMSIVESNYKALKLTKRPAIQEIVLPMTRDAAELINLQKRIIDVVELANKEFGMSPEPLQIRPIPLIESVPAILTLRPMLLDYKKGLAKMGFDLGKMRVMIGRSDLALAYGLGAAVLANVIALADMGELAHEGLEVNPILGGGTLPFRGHLTLENLDNTLEQYPGVDTFTLQSAMRYDHGRKKTAKLANMLKKKVGDIGPVSLDADERPVVLDCLGIFAKNYLQTISTILPLVIKISDLIPKQRDRLARKSEVGYARQLPQTELLADFMTNKEVADGLRKTKLGEYELPRAISFTASLYTVGLPPELIGTGRAIKEINKLYGKQGADIIAKHYPSLKADISEALQYTKLRIAASFFPSSFMKHIEKDIEILTDYLDIEVKEQNSFYFTVMETLKPMLKQLVSGSYVLSEEGLEKKLVTELVLKLGKLRKALG